MVDDALGKPVHEYTSDNVRLSLFEGGVRGWSRGQEIAARWEEVAFVKRLHQRATVVVVTFTSVRAEIHLGDGRVFVLEGSDDRAALAAQYVGSLSNPYIARRMMGELGAPGGVSFSADVRATAAGGIEVLRGGKWRSLPFDRIAGYKVTQAFCLIEIAGATPGAVTLREACAGKGVELKELVVAVAAAESGAPAFSEEPLPWYAGTDAFAFGDEKPKPGSVYPMALVARLLPGTAKNGVVSAAVRPTCRSIEIRSRRWSARGSRRGAGSSPLTSPPPTGPRRTSSGCSRRS